ncbi:superkiller complex helicase subunit twister isoform X1 [Rhodnius prolixus]|uniref:superkiller complex helicase subunit twister isoform X1 n=1 Tax=Rhodnius prolixus TaxID=13249 RepID=UPI003D18F3E0
MEYAGLKTYPEQRKWTYFMMSEQSTESDGIKICTVGGEKKRMLTLANVKRSLNKTEWAEELDMNKPCPMVEDPAMTFPFELDNFQKQAIYALENGFNVFVAAHTSAGKTVVAEYAIAMAQRNSSRSVYTSPVKALSNQKYNDFRHTFANVGLITGDIQINESADCLIMTTEILRSMLYNSSDKIRNLEFVIFDEVHYINDPERGHVWEEVLILLPSEVQIVMLSATVPNVIEFATWVGRTQQRKVHVCTTQHRPVPLQHYLYVGGGGVKERRYLVKDGDGPFLREKYFELNNLKKEEEIKQKQAKRKQIDKLRNMERKKQMDMAKKTGAPAENIKCPEYSELLSTYKANREKTFWREFINYLESNDWMPTVVFAFSRKTCDMLADLLSSVDLTTKTDKMHISSFFRRQIDKLDEIDRNLPQIVKMEGHLKNGIGVHHSGILPILKEIVEVLFQQGKVKMLFATETFAMGVNMPARTVVFNSIKKFDGNQLRLLLPSEYIQMAGRAGRRGKDSAGNVVIVTPPECLQKLEDLENMMLGTPCHLQSQFKLTYRMILNTLSSPGKITVQTIMARSYCENHSQLKHSQYKMDLLTVKQALDKAEQTVKEKLNDEEAKLLSNFFDKAFAYIKVYRKMRETILGHHRILKEINPGRLVRVSKGPHINQIGVVIDVISQVDVSQSVYRIMIPKVEDKFLDIYRPKHSIGDEEWREHWYRMLSWVPQLAVHTAKVNLFEDETKMISAKLYDIVEVFKTTLSLSATQIANILRDVDRSYLMKGRVKYSEDSFQLASKLSTACSKTLSVIDENGLRFNMDVTLKMEEMYQYKEDLDIARTCIFSMDKNEFLEKFDALFHWKQMQIQCEQLTYNLSDESMTLYPDYINKLAFLRERNFISQSDTVLMKGLMAARVGKYELVVSELLMENVLLELGPEEVAALLSVLVCQSKVGTSDTNKLEVNDFHQPAPTVAEEKVVVKPEDKVFNRDEDMHKNLPDSLNNAIVRVKAILKDLHDMEMMHNISDTDGSEGHKLSFDLVPIMYSWAKQQPFKEVMKVAQDYQEGLLVRYIQQLLEALKEVETAAKVMGDPAVPEKINQAGEKIKRGIVFAPSLYTTID